MLDKIYDALKEDFDAKLEALTGTGDMNPYTPPSQLAEANVSDVIEETNDAMADAADNNLREELHAESRKANLLMSMARDNHSATRTRLNQVKGYLLYIDRALYEAEPEDLTDSDGMLLANIKRVDL